MSTAESEKDRRSRMAYSTVNANPKKGGAGGAYTWGTAGDVTEYVPTTYAQPSVITAPPVVVQSVQTAAPFTASLSSAAQFPTLGTQPATSHATASAWTSVPAAVVQPAAATMVAAAPAAAAPETMRIARPSLPPQPVTSRVISQTVVTSNTGSVAAPVQYAQQPSYTYAASAASQVQYMQQPTFTYAAPVAREVPAEKDRRSRMSYSTVNAAPKKGGAGGAYTWGTAAGDVSEYVPTYTVQPSVMMAPAPAAAQPVTQSAPFNASLQSQEQFPGLGAPVAAPAPGAAWANRAVEVAAAPVEAVPSAPSSPVKATPAAESASSSPEKEAAKGSKKEEEKAEGSNCSVM
eukprot:gb/GFBE01022016.1/.p1 GENE.gb/GFBE01022016.1/~~gb/GFBE01022016.1/.p1  ORF type:complete len:348 (+),score=67.07 gb/GFBE01022016.1/:1-1044(+)